MKFTFFSGTMRLIGCKGTNNLADFQMSKEILTIYPSTYLPPFCLSVFSRLTVSRRLVRFFFLRNGLLIVFRKGSIH